MVKTLKSMKSKHFIPFALGRMKTKEIIIIITDSLLFGLKKKKARKKERNAKRNETNAQVEQSFFLEGNRVEQ